ncbi:MAG: MarR family winged helix-turn-helix transcriptional regulator [Rhodoblastus sp.]
MENDKSESAREAAAETKAPAIALSPSCDGEAPRHLDNVLGYMLRRAQVAVFNDFRRTFADYDLRPAQYAVLTILRESPGLRQGDVSAMLGIKRTNFVAVLDELERRGLTRREAVATDRRSRALYLTPAGKTLAEEVRKVQDEHEQRMIEFLPPGGRDQLIALLHCLTQGVGAGADDE